VRSFYIHTSSSHFDKVLADYKNDLANLLRENFGVDIRSKTRTYQKPYPTSFDSVAYTAGFRLPKFFKFSGKIQGALLSTLVSIFPN
jgi:hypothetical protein